MIKYSKSELMKMLLITLLSITGIVCISTISIYGHIRWTDNRIERESQEIRSVVTQYYEALEAQNPEESDALRCSEDLRSGKGFVAEYPDSLERIEDVFIVDRTSAKVVVFLSNAYYKELGRINEYDLPARSPLKLEKEEGSWKVCE